MIINVPESSWRVLESIANDNERRRYLGDVFEAELAEYADDDLRKLPKEERGSSGPQHCLRFTPMADFAVRQRAKRIGMPVATMVRAVINAMGGI